MAPRLFVILHPSIRTLSLQISMTWFVVDCRKVLWRKITRGANTGWFFFCLPVTEYQTDWIASWIGPNKLMSSSSSDDSIQISADPRFSMKRQSSMSASAVLEMQIGLWQRRKAQLRMVTLVLLCAEIHRLSHWRKMQFSNSTTANSLHKTPRFLHWLIDWSVWNYIS